MQEIIRGINTEEDLLKDLQELPNREDRAAAGLRMMGEVEERFRLMRESGDPPGIVERTGFCVARFGWRAAFRNLEMTNAEKRTHLKRGAELARAKALLRNLRQSEKK